MTVAGLQKTTLLDFPGKVACTVFLRGCNFRCPFCQNSEILDGGEGDLSEEELFSFLNKRKGMLDGVCISGGEPLLFADVVPFIRKIRALGYAIKLDTNGAFPARLKALCEEGLIDFVAMDIKNSPEKYEKTAGVKVNMDAISESVDFLLHGNIPYEFRTTVVKELHSGNDFVQIGRWIRGANRYFLQTFRDSDNVLCTGLSACSDAQMQAFKEIVRPFVPHVLIRGEE